MKKCFYDWVNYLTVLFFIAALITLSAATNAAPGPNTIGNDMTPEEYAALDRIRINSPNIPPGGFLPVADINSADVILHQVPTSTWTFGSAPTAAGIILGYYDRMNYPSIYDGNTNAGDAPLFDLGQGSDPENPFSWACGLVASANGFDNHTGSGHVDDYWLQYGATGLDPWDPNDPCQPNNTRNHDCIADYMGSNQWRWDYNLDGVTDNVSDGATMFFFPSDGSKLYDFIPPDMNQVWDPCLPIPKDMNQAAGCHGMRQFVEKYVNTNVGPTVDPNYVVEENYNQYIMGYADPGIGFTFADYKDQIDNGYPVMIHFKGQYGHSSVGVGYQDANQIVYIHDTWDNDVHEFVWGDYYAGLPHIGVTVFHLERVPVLKYLQINGPNEVPEFTVAAGDYNCTAYWDTSYYGRGGGIESNDVSGVVEWKENTIYASIANNGVLSTNMVPSDQVCAIAAVYRSTSPLYGDTSATYVVTIKDTDIRLETIEISGPVIVDEDSNARFTCRAYYSDDSVVDVTSDPNTTWSEDSAFASIDANGLLDTDPVSSNQPCRIKATYSGMSDWYFVTILDSAANIIYVDDDANGFEDGSQAHPYNTIQEGIDAASSGYIVLVADGNYIGAGNRDINLLSKAITVSAASGPEAVIIDCQGTKTQYHRGFYLGSATGPDTLIEGFTIKNAYALSGAGIYCEIGSTAAIRSCTIRKCRAADTGGGVAGTGGRISYSNIVGNVGNNSGGGLYDCSGQVMYSTLLDNVAGNYGGGLYFCDADISYSKIIGNEAGRQGGGFYECGGDVSFCTVAQNQAHTEFGGGFFGCTANISDCNFIANKARYGAAICTHDIGAITSCRFIANIAGISGGAIADSDVSLAQCFFSNNYAATNGGAIYGCDGQISDCNVTNNTAGISGGGIYASNGSIVRCRVEDNWARSGGGFYVCNGLIKQTVVKSNEAIFTGGGFGNCDGRIENCLVLDNHCDWIPGGKGAGFSGCDGEIVNCTVVKNVADANGGGFNSCDAMINSCIVWYNDANNNPHFADTNEISYSCVQGWTAGGLGNISADPLFANPDTDFHLKSSAGRWNPNTGTWVTDIVTSPCIDSGSPWNDWTRELWPNGQRVNMGAYGGTPQASKSNSSAGIIADLNVDFFVDTLDLAMLLAEWLNNGLLMIEDLNHDGTVDYIDFAMFAAFWQADDNDPLFPAYFLEDFETANFTRYPWKHKGTKAWTVVHDAYFEGAYSAGSGDITHDQNSILDITWPCVNTNRISFYKKTSCEEDYDYLEFYIDGDLEGFWSGWQNWTRSIFLIEPNQPHNFRWVYQKDGSVSEWDDSIWLDNIRLYNDPR
ncbi:MAG: C39 family peptidase [Planctomycetota bacterium]